MLTSIFTNLKDGVDHQDTLALHLMLIQRSMAEHSQIPARNSSHASDASTMGHLVMVGNGLPTADVNVVLTSAYCAPIKIFTMSDSRNEKRGLQLRLKNRPVQIPTDMHQRNDQQYLQATLCRSLEHQIDTLAVRHRIPDPEYEDKCQLHLQIEQCKVLQHFNSRVWNKSTRNLTWQLLESKSINLHLNRHFRYS